MQAANPHISRIRHIAQALSMAVLCMTLPQSCSDDDNPQQGPGNRCEATLRFDIASFGQAGETGSRSYVTGNDDENAIEDIWVFQYNEQTRAIMRPPVYLDEFDTNDLQVDLELNENEQLSLVCIVANTKDQYWALDEDGNTRDEFSTYEKLVEHALPAAVSDPFLSQNMGDGGGETIPMFGVSDAMAIVAKCYVAVPLIRTFARLEVSVEEADAVALGMSLKSIIVSDIPSYCRVSTLAPAKGDAYAAEYPADVDWTTFDMTASNGYSIYFPENLQGKVSGMTSKQEAESGFPERALKVNVTMSYEKDGTPVSYTYTVYPGLDMVNDFNIKRNLIYKVNIRFTKLPE